MEASRMTWTLWLAWVGLGKWQESCWQHRKKPCTFLISWIQRIPGVTYMGSLCWGIWQTGLISAWQMWQISMQTHYPEPGRCGPLCHYALFSTVSLIPVNTHSHCRQITVNSFPLWLLLESMIRIAGVCGMLVVLVVCTCSCGTRLCEVVGSVGNTRDDKSPCSFMGSGVMSIGKMTGRCK